MKSHRTSPGSKKVHSLAGTIRRHRRVLNDEYKVREIGLFGSVVRGTAKRNSDVDILVDFVELPDLLRFIELERYLQTILKKKVDLVDRGGLRPGLREAILSEVVFV